jgi:hypothetical protein
MYILPKRMYHKEVDVKKTIKEILQYYKVFNFMPIASGYGSVGIPDFIGILPNGQFFSVEAKCIKTKGKLSGAQKQVLLTIEKNQGVALVVDETSFKVLIDFLELRCA